MNTSKYLLLTCCVMISLGLASCSKYLDKKPDNLLTEDQVWQTRANAEAYLYNIYGYVDGYGASTDGAVTIMGSCDETAVSISTTNVRQIAAGNWSSSDWYGYIWGAMYTAIRKTIIFEENIDKVPTTQLSDNLKRQYKSEAIFLRGYYYWLILRQYGPFVKLTTTLSTSDDFNKYPRATFDTCTRYINNLMDQAAAGLPAEWASSSNYGRPTKGACMMVKAKIAQLAASPLWNGNPGMANLKNQDGTALAPAGYDINKWKIAAADAKAIIDAGHYHLFTAADPYHSVRDLFTTNWSDEIIFAHVNWYKWGYTKCVSPGPGGYNMYGVTQNMVDMFSMNNGRTIDDPASGYTESGFAQTDGVNSWEQKHGDWNMYANREPRFYAYVAYNGRPVVPALTTDDKNYFSSDANVDGRGRMEFYYNGKSGQKTTTSGTITGYLPLKYVSPNDNIRYGTVNNPAPYILFRYAEVLLDYVEALNEYDPGNPDIVTYLNQVRSRAGLPGIETVYPGAVGNKDQMRKNILRERAVEMCFENGDRYFTLLRRLMMGNQDQLNIYGLSVDLNDNGLGFSFTDFYKRKLYLKRYWDNKMYLFPIQQKDIERDRSLVQNPGW